MAPKTAALATVLALGCLRSATAVCNVTANCTACTEEECSQTAGCFDNSPEDYDMAYCSPYRMQIGGGDDSGFMSEDCMASLGMGAGGGLFFAVLPMVLLFARKRKAYQAHLISAPESEVTRAQAVLKEKYTKTSSSSEGGSTTYYYFKLEFVAKHTDGTAYDVKASVFADEKVYQEVEVGGNIEVVFPVNDERKFEILKNLTVKTSMAGKAFLMFFFGTFSLAGIGLGALSVIATGCDAPWGVIAFVPISVVLCVLAYFFGVSSLQKLASMWQRIEVTPATNSTVLQATVVNTA